MNDSAKDALITKSNKVSAAWRNLLYTRNSISEPEKSARLSIRSRRIKTPVDYAGGSLFGDILDFMLAPLLLLWPLSIGITFLVARALADAPFDRVLEDRLMGLAQQVNVNNGSLIVTLPKAAREVLRSDDEDKIYFQVLHPVQKIIAGDADLPPPKLYDFPEIDKVKWRTEIINGDEVRIAYLEIDLGSSTPGSVLIQVGETLAKRSRLANEIIKGVILPQFIILPLSVVLVWFGLKQGLRPLTQLRRKIDQRLPGDMSPINPKQIPEEIGPLVETFNDLLARLNETMNAQRRFIGDAAHQLKTPLAGLRTQAELALREPNRADLKIGLRQLSRSAEQTARLVDQLLALARAEHHRIGLPMHIVKLNSLAKEVCADWVVAAIARNIDLGFDGNDSALPIEGHTIVLREMMNNLIDNALRYTPAGGRVTVRVSGSVLGAVRLEVEDNGVGISEGDQQLVFDRFYRVLGNASDGSGLGLAIVKEIAEQHNAQITIASYQKDNPDRMPHGTKISIVFST